MATSANHGKIFIHSSVSNNSPITVFDSSTATVSSSDTLFTASRSISPSRTGDVFLRNGNRNTNLYNDQFTDLGLVSSSLADTALSPDFSLAYVNNTYPRLETHDLTKPDGFGGFSKLIEPFTRLSANPGPNGAMTISQDGNTLFLIGSQNLVVQPAPR